MKSNKKAAQVRTNQITEDKVRLAIRKIVSEEYNKIMTEAPEAPGAAPTAGPANTGGIDSVINKLMNKIPNLPAVQQLIRRIPQRAPKAAAEIIMSIISAMEERTSEPKAKLISRELIYMLRDKIQGKGEQ